MQSTPGWKGELPLCKRPGLLQQRLLGGWQEQTSGSRCRLSNRADVSLATLPHRNSTAVRRGAAPAQPHLQNEAIELAALLAWSLFLFPSCLPNCLSLSPCTPYSLFFPSLCACLHVSYSVSLLSMSISLFPSCFVLFTPGSLHITSANPPNNAYQHRRHITEPHKEPILSETSQACP